MDEKIDEIILKAIRRHAGLSEWDEPDILWEVKAIRKALKKHGYKIVLTNH